MEAVPSTAERKGRRQGRKESGGREWGRLTGGTGDAVREKGSACDAALWARVKAELGRIGGLRRGHSCAGQRPSRAGQHGRKEGEGRAAAS